ncbi:MAG: hypothetical protein OHK0039_41560 [Bacteroidia bacterium]
MNLPRLSLTLALLVLFWTSCRKEEVPPQVYEVPDLVEEYVVRFEQEAASRGLDLTIDNLRVSFASDLQGGDAAGLCTFANQDNPTPHVQLDTTSFNWRNNLNHREILVFHELGHCILNRLHRDDDLPNSNIASIMRSTGEQVYGGSLNAFKRDYYLDELFDTGTPVPTWARSRPAYGGVTPGESDDPFTEHFANNFNQWTTGSSAQASSQISSGRYFFQSKTSTAIFTAKSIAVDTTRDFEIELSVRIASGTSPIMFLWGGSGDEFFYTGFSADSTVFAGTWEHGLDMARTLDAVVPAEYNKITLRRSGGFYHLYLNEAYVDVFAFQPFYGDKIGFYVGGNTAMEVDYIFVKYP